MPALLLFLVAMAASPPAQEGPVWGPWHLLGPLDHPEGAVGVRKPLPPEGFLRRRGPGPPPLQAAWEGKGGASLGWKRLEGLPEAATALDTGVLDFRRLLDPIPGVAWDRNAVVYLYREVRCPLDTVLPISCGSDDGLRLWLNGQLLLEFDGGRSLNPRSHYVELPLRAGVNHLFIKVTQGDGAWSFRMTDGSRLPPGRESLQGRIHTAIDGGVRWLLERQLLDGSWSFANDSYGSGYTGLALYTLLKAGVPRDHPAVLQAAAWIRAHPPEKTYAVSTVLLALNALGNPEDLRFLEQLAAAMGDWSDSGQGGLWRYGPGLGSDLSNTIFAALAFRAVAEAGVEVPSRVWERMLRGVLRVRGPEAQVRAGNDLLYAAGFAYRDGGSPTGSMTTAGIATLAICREQLGNRLAPRERQEVDRAIEAGLAWLQWNWSVEANPGVGAWHLYHLYGLERVGSLLGLDEIGPYPWYWLGAEWLVERQSAEGNWTGASSPTAETDTCLALLFLSRATAGLAVTGEGKAPPRPPLAWESPVWSQKDPAAPLRLRATGDTPLTVWVQGFGGPDLKYALWPGEEDLGPRVRRVEYRARPVRGGAGFQTLGVVDADPGRPVGSERFALQAALPEPGEWEIQAVAELLLPPLTEGDPPVPDFYVSPPLKVRVLDPRGAWRRSYPEDDLRNLLRRVPVQAEASSRSWDGASAARAVDGWMGTAWTFAAADPEPWLRLRLGRPVRANRLLLSPSHNQLLHLRSPLVSRVEVRVNDDDLILEADLSLFVQKKSVIDLPKALAVRSLEIRVLALDGAALGRASAGFAEVELQRVR